MLLREFLFFGYFMSGLGMVSICFIDKSIAEVGRAERLEKGGNYDAAQKLILDQAKIARETWAAKLRYESERKHDITQERIAHIKAEGAGGDKYLTTLITKRTDIEGKITAREKEYPSLVRLANRDNPKKDPELQKKIDTARTQLKDKMGDLYEQRDEVDRLIKSHKKIMDTDTSAKSTPKAETVTIGDKTYTRPAGFTDQQWADYKKSQGVK